MGKEAGRPQRAAGGGVCRVRLEDLGLERALPAAPGAEGAAGVGEQGDSRTAC